MHTTRNAEDAESAKDRKEDILRESQRICELQFLRIFNFRKDPGWPQKGTKIAKENHFNLILFRDLLCLLRLFAAILFDSAKP
jgi:hypothetical protein